MWVFRHWKLPNEESFDVGYYDPEGDFVELYEFEERIDAAQKVHFLNGGD